MNITATERAGYPARVSSSWTTCSAVWLTMKRSAMAAIVI
jgi:hypothetical protein